MLSGPSTPSIAMPQVDPAAIGQRAESTIPIQREPWDERLPDGRSVSEAMRQLEPRDAGILSADDPRAQQRRGWMVSPASSPDGQLPAKRGSYSDRMAQIDMLRRAPVTSDVERREKGGFQAQIPKKPSRLKQILVGLGQGAIIGASKTGTWQGALGGAATGGVSGGVSPRLMKAFTRDQEIRRLQGQLDDDMELQKGQAALEGIQAQTAYNQKRARTGDKRYVERKDGVYEISDEYPEGRKVGGIGPEGDTEETLVDYVDPEGRTFKVKPKEAADLYQRDRKPVSDAQEGQALEGETAASEAGAAIEELKKELDDLRGPYNDGVKSIAQKNAIWKAKAAKLVADDPTGETTLAEAMERVKADDPDFVSGTYGETETNTKSKAERIAQLEKEILDINKERRGGRAKAARGGTSKGKKGGRFSGQVLPRANLKSVAERWKVTPEEAERIFSSGGGLIK